MVSVKWLFWTLKQVLLRTLTSGVCNKINKAVKIGMYIVTIQYLELFAQMLHVPGMLTKGI